ncbi:unnamed protein product, partial [marine sediment metagenome]
SSETPEAIKDRVRRHREKQVTENPLHPLTTTTVKDIEAEVEVEGKSVTLPLQRNGKSVTAEAALAEIATLHEENFGITL